MHFEQRTAFRECLLPSPRRPLPSWPFCMQIDANAVICIICNAKRIHLHSFAAVASPLFERLAGFQMILVNRT